MKIDLSWNDLIMLEENTEQCCEKTSSVRKWVVSGRGQIQSLVVIIENIWPQNVID